MRIKKHIAVLRWAAILLSALWYLPSQAQTTDSLSHYLETAARYNPSVNSSFALYKASLEKIPQAGAFSDPELEMGFFFKPMEQLSGKQVADFTLMQMFPWFGTRKAARNEATEMARMAYEQFRETRNNLFYEVKSQWYQLNNLNEQYKNTAANLELLKQLELLALSRYTASSVLGRPTPSVAPPVASPVPQTPANNSMGGMENMGDLSFHGLCDTGRKYNDVGYGRFDGRWYDGERFIRQHVRRTSHPDRNGRTGKQPRSSPIEQESSRSPVQQPAEPGSGSAGTNFRFAGTKTVFHRRQCGPGQHHPLQPDALHARSGGKRV